ncbi:MAG: hypothetical protein H6Q15_2128 [Bacteroidetes bacterium]|nr:hypothetical protein [Bacteroidota bacterium]
MKKRNVFYIISFLVLGSILMATSCKDDDKDNNNKPTPPTPTENPMYKNKINELRSYVGISDSAFKAIMTDSLGLVEDVFDIYAGKKISYYDCPYPKEYVYEVFTNIVLGKVYCIVFYHWLDHDTLIKICERYSNELSKTLPLDNNYTGEIYAKDKTEYFTSDRNEYKIHFQLKKDTLMFCGETYRKDSIYHFTGYQDFASNLNHSWTYIAITDHRLAPNIFPKKSQYSILNYKLPFIRRR